MGQSIIEFGKMEVEYFCADDWTGVIVLSGLMK